MKSGPAVFDAFFPVLGRETADLLVDRMENIKKGVRSEPWKKAVFSLVADAVEKHGAGGVKLSSDAIGRLLRGKAPKLDWADLAAASDVLAQMQNLEAGRRADVKDFLAEVGWVLGVVGTALIKSLL